MDSSKVASLYREGVERMGRMETMASLEPGSDSYDWSVCVCVMRVYVRLTEWLV